MQGLDEFLETFGHITIAEVVAVVLAIVFLVAIYRKISDYLMKRHDAAQEKDAHLKEALEAVRRYPEYRQQSVKIQELLEDEIQELRVSHGELAKRLEDGFQRLIQLEEQNKKRECNKLRDMLLQNYRYYTNECQNPSKSWTKMEAEAFWELFHDYEEAGGNGYMHTVVQPEMERLIVIEVGK